MKRSVILAGGAAGAIGRPSLPVHVTQQPARILQLQEAAMCAFYVLVAEDGSVLGRFNLDDFEDGTAA